MRAQVRLIPLVFVIALGACAAKPPRWRPEAIASLQQASRAKSDLLYPDAYQSAHDALLKGEEFLAKGHKREAENLYLLALQKSDLLNTESAAERARQAREAARLAEEQRLAEERRKAAEEEAESRRLQEKALQAPKAPPEVVRRRVKPTEKRPATTYTVRRGESLPLIAAQAEVYSDRTLWPLLYRANRDQISDPHHIWPGQVLRIPRNLNREDLSEARRYAQERPLH